MCESEGTRAPPPPCGEVGLGRRPSRVGGAGAERGDGESSAVEPLGLVAEHSELDPAPPVSAWAAPESALPRKGGERASARRRRWLAVAGGALAAACVAAAIALWSFVASLGPLDLSAAEKRSTVVLDRDG